MQNEIAAMKNLQSKWFAGLDHGPDQENIVRALDHGDEIISERNAIREMEGGGICAQRVAESLEMYFCWPVARGTVIDEYGDPVALHYWNVTKDGWIIDASADAHDDASPELRLIAPGSDTSKRYRPEWTADYNPGKADAYPELEDIYWVGIPDAEIIAERDMGLTPVLA